MNPTLVLLIFVVAGLVLFVADALPVRIGFERED
jgi:hypothetical protein